MPSGKPRKHGRNLGGRPSNNERYEALNGKIRRLQQLVSHKNHSDETWNMIDRLLAVIDELEELSSPLRAATYGDGTSPSAERPIFPGVQITTQNRIVHAGSYATALSVWLHRQIEWTITSAERRLTGVEQDPKPKMPRRETSEQSQGPETHAAIG